MAGTLPSTPAFAGVTIKNNQPNIVTISTSGRRQVKTQQTQFWSFNATYPPMKRADWAPIAGFMAKQRGSAESFVVVLPEYSNTQGNATLTITVNGAHTAGDTSISVSGQSGLSDALKAGDFIRFSTGTNAHNKVYMVTDDLDFTGASGTLNIQPGLVTALDGGSTGTAETVQYNGVEFTVFMAGDVQEYNTGLAGMVEYELELREAL